MISLSGSGDSWWQQCCSSPALSSSPVRVGPGQKGHRDSGRGALETEGQGLKTTLGEAVQTQVPHSCDSAPRKHHGAVLRVATGLSQQGALFPGRWSLPLTVLVFLGFSWSPVERGKGTQRRHADSAGGYVHHILLHCKPRAGFVWEMRKQTSLFSF